MLAGAGPLQGLDLYSEQDINWLTFPLELGMTVSSSEFFLILVHPLCNEFSASYLRVIPCLLISVVPKPSTVPVIQTKDISHINVPILATYPGNFLRQYNAFTWLKCLLKVTRKDSFILGLLWFLSIHSQGGYVLLLHNYELFITHLNKREWAWNSKDLGLTTRNTTYSHMVLNKL